MDYENLRPAEKAQEFGTESVYDALVGRAMEAATKGLHELSLYWRENPHADKEAISHLGEINGGTMDVYIYRARQYDISNIAMNLRSDGFVLTFCNHSVLGEVIDTVSWEEQE